jgi:hypothetical protein
MVQQVVKGSSMFRSGFYRRLHVANLQKRTSGGWQGLHIVSVRDTYVLILKTDVKVAVFEKYWLTLKESCNMYCWRGLGHITYSNISYVDCWLTAPLVKIVLGIVGWCPGYKLREYNIVVGKV